MQLCVCVCKSMCVSVNVCLRLMTETAGPNTVHAATAKKPTLYLRSKKHSEHESSSCFLGDECGLFLSFVLGHQTKPQMTYFLLCVLIPTPLTPFPQPELSQPIGFTDTMAGRLITQGPLQSPLWLSHQLPHAPA